MAVVGIDLGTTNTVVACVRDGQVHVLADEDGYRLLPSIVSFHPNGDVLVGREARDRRLIDAENTVGSIKRLIGRPWNSDEMRIARERFSFELREGAGQGALVVARGETYTLPEISAFVLKRVRQIAEAALGEVVDQAVITVPAHFNELQRASTKVAGRVAGLEVLRILNEPTAAALAYGFGSEHSERVAVYDFGGGTFDCSVLDLSGSLFEVLATSGDTFLGGDDIDTAIADVMCSAFLAEHRFDPRKDPQAFERLRAGAEALKRALSFDAEAQIEIPEVAVNHEGRVLSFTFGMTQADLDFIAGPLIERTLEVTQDALTVAGLAPSSLDQIVVVGGSTRMPIVRRRVEAFFGLTVHDQVDPDEVVAIGAAVQAAALVDPSRFRSVPAAPIPGVIGAPQRLDSEAPYSQGGRVPGARTRSGTMGRIETLRPKALQTLRPPVDAVPPPAALLDRDAPTMLGNTGEERSFVTANRGVAAEAPESDGAHSFGSHQTLPAGTGGEDEPLSTTNIRVGLPLGPSPLGPSIARPRTTPMEEPPRTMGAARLRTKPQEAPARGWRDAKPLDTQDISLVGAAGEPSMLPEWHTPSAHPPAPASNSLSPYGVNVGPLPTEDISILGESPLPALRSELPSPLGPGRRDLPARPVPQARRSEPGLPAFSPGLPAFPAPAALPAAAPRRGESRPPPAPLPPPRVPSIPPGPPPQQPRIRTAAPNPEAARPPPPPEPAPPLVQRPTLKSQGEPDTGSFASKISFDVSASMSGVDAPRRDLAKTKPPILVDVTPCALVVETVGGYCDTVIPRNATIPCEHTRVFATGRDLQSLVHVRVAQGEAQKFDDNQYLGEVEVSNLRPAPRGEILLSVTFEIDANGSLVVRAVDASTGRKVEASMKLITVTQSESDIEGMIERSLSVSVKAKVG